MLTVTRLTMAVAVAFGSATIGAVAAAPPAHASGCSLLGGATSNGTTVQVTGSVSCSSSSGAGGGSGSSGGSGYAAPPCWLAPRYTGKSLWDNFHGSTDHIGFLAIPRPGQAEQYKNTPPSKGVWWVPVSNGTAAGDTCAYGLYWPEFGPPPTPGSAGPAGYPVMNQREASAMAEKQLQLPPLDVQLSPRTRTYVNLPTWVSAHYQNPVSATATISIPVLGTGIIYTVRATVTARVSGGLHISVPGGTGQVADSGCGPYGSGSQGNHLSCGVTFTEPSTAGPFPITVSTTWHVTGPGVNTYRPDSQTAHATVAEIQSLNQ
ncbi:MAG TPA: hypothetical protein VGM53_10545 [Streptosporangiaceae bacterium]|jgi:enoyl reductase